MARSHYRKGSRQPQKMRLPAPKGTLIEAVITHHDTQGFGYASTDIAGQQHKLRIAGALAGEKMQVQLVAAQKPYLMAEIASLIQPAEMRQAPPCPDFEACGGCQLQHMTIEAYQDLKVRRVADALEQAGFERERLCDFHAASQAGRRRARIGMRRTEKGPIVGFRGRASHQLIRPTNCLVLAPELRALWPVLEEITQILLPKGGQAEAQVNLLSNGVDMLISADETEPAALIDLPSLAQKAGLVRLSLSEKGAEAIPLYAPAQAVLRFGTTEIMPPAGCFLQASEKAEQILQNKVSKAVEGATRIADLFCGVGTLSLPLLAQGAFILGADAAKPALEAFKDASNKAGRGNQLRLLVRDLMKAPVLQDELAEIDAVILDPPRAGASAQMAVICKAQIPVVAMVSCHLGSFMRDAGALKEAGYHLDWVELVDQFQFSSHIELVARFYLPEADERKSQKGS